MQPQPATPYKHTIRELVQEQELDPAEWDEIWQLYNLPDQPLRLAALNAAVQQHPEDAAALICGLLESIHNLKQLPQFITIEGIVS